MDILAELESMAVNVSLEDDEYVSREDAARWTRLFGFTDAEARHRIEEYRADFTRKRISDSLWTTLKADKEADGFDREAYEYSLAHQKAIFAARPAQKAVGTFIIQLEGLLNSAQKVQEAAALSAAPAVATGTNDCGKATQFCEIDGHARAKILNWLAWEHAGFQPTIVRLAKAKKDLCTHSPAPTLAVEAILPQHRLDDSITPLPAQDQYPVWYFFYGTLGEPEILSRQLGLEGPPELVPASVYGGQIRTWAGKYRALVDAPGSRVEGKAFFVRDREQEDALRFYETDKYEVARCQIDTENGQVPGLTFRFNGRQEELD